MPPDYQPPGDAIAQMALTGTSPFVMQADGKGWLFVPDGLLDGPLPTHYEPHESPLANPLYRQQSTPPGRSSSARATAPTPRTASPAATSSRTW